MLWQWCWSVPRTFLMRGRGLAGANERQAHMEWSHNRSDCHSPERWWHLWHSRTQRHKHFFHWVLQSKTATNKIPAPLPFQIPQSKTRCFGDRKASQMSALKRKSLLAPSKEHQKLRATRLASDHLAFRGNAPMLRMQWQNRNCYGNRWLFVLW